MRPLYADSDSAREVAIEPAGSYRSDFRRDYARLLHSPAFRRLQGKTQLFPGAESDFFRNRLTHSLEVAQIAKSIAARINEEYEYFRQHAIDLDLIETAALAHDLGHPPFGHVGESALDHCMREHGGFEGNAQTLRIVAKLEKRERRGRAHQSGQSEDGRVGLNLTYRTLAALLKYDKPIPPRRIRRRGPVKGYYGSEAALVSRVKQHVLGLADDEVPESGAFKTIECHIMDIADDIAYSTYDLEDALKTGFVTPMSMISALGSKRIVEAVKDATGLAEDRIFGLVIDLWRRNLRVEDADSGGLDAATSVHQVFHNLAQNGTARTLLTSEMVNECVEAVVVEVNERVPPLSKVALETNLREQVEAIKILTYELVVASPNLQSVEYRGRRIVTEIFDALTGSGGELLLPDDYRSQLEDETTPRERTICDFIAAMTDRYAQEFFGRLYAEAAETIFKPL